MTRTVLIVGGTGNTGRSVVTTAASLMQNSLTLSGHRLVAVTRSISSPAAEQLAKVPGVELQEKNWVEIDADWLRILEVERIFIAPHNEPNQFAEESQFLVNALKANVQYVVRISTTVHSVRPDFLAYYPRSHWAIENMLSQPEFKNLHWSSLQPNGFLSLYLSPVAEFIKEFRKSDKQGTLGIMLDENSPVALIDPHDVGVFAARLLCEPEPSLHNKTRFVLNGPEDITGNHLVKLVEEIIGTKVENVRYKDLSYIELMAQKSPESNNLIMSIQHALEIMWQGNCLASTTCQKVLDLAEPKRTAADVLKDMIKGSEPVQEYRQMDSRECSQIPRPRPSHRFRS